MQRSSFIAAGSRRFDARPATLSLVRSGRCRSMALLPLCALGVSALALSLGANSAVAQGVTQENINTPAAAPEERPRGLEVPVGPEQPPGDEPAAPPATTTQPLPPTPRPTAPVPTAPAAPPIIGNAAAAEGREISEIRVVGNRVVPTETILAQLRTQRGTPFSRRQVELDRGRIDTLGFFASVQAQVTPEVTDPNRVILTYIVTENRVITAFKFVGNTAIDEADLVKVLKSQIGTVLNRTIVNQDVSAVQQLYRDRGFAILVQGARQLEDGTLQLTIAEASISKIELSGLKKTKPSLIRSQIRTKPGEIFDATKIRKDLNRIYDTGFFEDVSFKVDDDPDTPGSVIVTILLKERRTGQFSVGLGFDSRSQLSGFVTLSESNFRGTGRRAIISAETGSRQNYELGYGDPFIGPKNASYDISIYNRSIIREPRLLVGGGGVQVPEDRTVTFEEERTGGRLSFTKPLDYDRRRTLLFGYRNERAKLVQRDQDGNTVPIDEFADTGTVSAFSIGFLRDTRDLRLETSRGGRESLIVEKAFSVLGGDSNFTKLNLDLRRYFPLMGGEKATDPAKLVLAGRVVLGRSINQLPAFEQYYVGGSDTVRGYESDTQFGDNQYFGNLELRYRFQSKIQAVLFADAGTAFGGRFSSGSGADVLYSVGVGARLQTPIGPIRLDVGRGRDGVRTHFAIGPTF